MTKWQNLYPILMKLIETPNNKKVYKDLQDCYLAHGMQREAAVIENLIQKRYENNNSDAELSSNDK